MSKTNLKIVFLKSHSNLPGTNELTLEDDGYFEDWLCYNGPFDAN